MREQARVYLYYTNQYMYFSGGGDLIRTLDCVIRWIWILCLCLIVCYYVVADVYDKINDHFVEISYATDQICQNVNLQYGVILLLITYCER